MMNRVPTVFAVVLGLVATVAAPEALRAGRPRTHDGLFLRLSAGFGSAGTAIDIPGTGGVEEFSFSGASGDVNLAIGGMVAPDVALHGTIWGWNLTDPKLEVDDAAGTFHGDVTMSAVGPGVTWYIMPANLYLSASVGFATLAVETGRFRGETDGGFAADLTFGKEWWVGDAWGLGLAGAVGWSSISENEVSDAWTGFSVGLRFSATLN